MFNFLLAGLSVWLLVMLYRHKQKGTVPDWMHKQMYADRYIKDPQKAPYFRNSLWVWPTVIFMLFAPFCIIYFFYGLAHPYETWQAFGHDTFLSTAAVILGLVTPFYLGRNIRDNFAHYTETVVAEEKQAQVKQALGVKDWATTEQVLKVLPQGNGPNGKTIGIHLGQGYHWYDKGHMLTVGGSGQGKGVNLILPAILSNGFVAGGISLVCLDPKGENAAVAANFLKRSGYDVHVLNPTGIKEIAQFGNARFNPFDLIDADDEDASRLYDVLAMALHNRRGQGDNSFFDNRCRQYISLYLAYAHHVKMGNWETVYNWLTMSGDRRKELLASMSEDETFAQANTARAISDRLTGEAGKTEESIYGTIEEAIDILKNKKLRASLAVSDFDMRTIAQKPTAIFLCVPFEDLDYYAPWVRMFFNFMLRTLTKYYNTQRKVLVLLDEFPQLSYMDEVTRSAAVLRGYNVTLWPVVQSLGQLKKIYGESWEIFINSSVVKHWLAAGTDNTTADYLEKRMPIAARFLGQNADGSPKYTEGRLLSGNDAMGFEHIVCELSKLDRPIKFNKVPYWELPFTRDNAAKNPFYL